MTRTKPPTRRECETADVWYKGERYHVSYGCSDGVVVEAFIHGAKIGSDLDALACTASTCISIALQYGARVGDLSHAAIRLEDGSPADFIGAVLDFLTEIENDKD